MKKGIKFFLPVLSILTGIETTAQDVYNLWEGQTNPYYKENSLIE